MRALKRFQQHNTRHEELHHAIDLVHEFSGGFEASISATLCLGINGVWNRDVAVIDGHRYGEGLQAQPSKAIESSTGEKRPRCEPWTNPKQEKVAEE